VRFTFARPAHGNEHARVFETKPQFDSREAALVLSRTAWELPTRTPDPGLFSLLDDHARRLAGAAAAEDLPGVVRAAIAADLPGPAPRRALAIGAGWRCWPRSARPSSSGRNPSTESGWSRPCRRMGTDEIMALARQDDGAAPRPSAGATRAPKGRGGAPRAVL
jgi:hypothetical protein